MDKTENSKEQNKSREDPEQAPSFSETKESIISNTILAKYSSVWIWSIVVGINSALTYSFYSYRQSNWLALGIILSIFYGFAFLFCLFAWVRLANFLRTVIIPLIEQSFKSSSYKSIDTATTNFDFQSISNAFQLLIYALSCRFFAFILELIFSSLK